MVAALNFDDGLPELFLAGGTRITQEAAEEERCGGTHVAM